MAHVSGPTSSMPGSVHKVLPNINDGFCDEHPGVEAVALIQGETDSFGAEYAHACQGCVDMHRSVSLARPQRDGYCDWHKGHGSNIKQHRDFEEGSSGPLYDVCADCRKKENERLDEELALNDRDDW